MFKSLNKMFTKVKNKLVKTKDLAEDKKKELVKELQELRDEVKEKVMHDNKEDK